MHCLSLIHICGEEIVSRPTIDVVQIAKGKPFIFTATFAVKPEVTLGEYKGVEVEKASAEVTDEDVDAEIEMCIRDRMRAVKDYLSREKKEAAAQ